MNIVTLDFETYFGDDYTLSKMTTESYIRDPRFEVLGLAVRFINGDTQYFPDPDQFLRHFREEPSTVAFLCHHAQFDGLILSHHYGIKPKFWFDTLSMARLLLGNHLSAGLDSLARHFGLQAKTVPYNLFKNKHWAELDPHTQQLVAGGAVHDVNLTWEIFKILAKDFPREEYRVVDTVIRMFTEPVLQGDIDLLADIWRREAVAKERRLKALGVTTTELQSADKFAALLRRQGVEPQTKDGKKNRIYCFAKTDQFMRDLLGHDNDTVRDLAEARLGQKSTFMQTRAETMGWMARRGPMPVYLFMYGAGTLRPSGGDGANFLNLKRNSDIRRAIMAPDGYLLGPIDASQIEFRVCNYLAGQDDMLELLRRGGDPYIGLASEFYGERIYKPARGDPREKEMEMKRGAGKQGRLMCIYGSAALKFKETAKAGLYGPPIDMSIEDAARFVQITRRSMPRICDYDRGYWGECDRMLRTLAEGRAGEWGPLRIRDRKICLPNGCMMHYDTLEWHVPDDDEDNVKDFERDGYWRVLSKSGWKKMWGSKLTQNICEAVSRCIVSQAMIRIVGKGARVLNWPYDELLLLIPDDKFAEERLEECRRELLVTPEWLPGIPLDADAKLGKRYAK